MTIRPSLTLTPEERAALGDAVTRTLDKFLGAVMSGRSPAHAAAIQVAVGLEVYRWVIHVLGDEPVGEQL